MPRRDDLDSVLIIGAGPIVIGQACEFDYSGTQACKALKEEGYRVILVNSNPATIMTDPEFADRTYIEPIVPEVLERIVAAERSSALASKATGFPIAKIAAKLAIGYTLDEIKNDITRETPACFEPTIDYVVTKIPRFAFEKFKGADDTLTTQMKSVGEVMAIGRTFQESFQKALRGLEIDKSGLESPLGKGPRDAYGDAERDRIRDEMRVPRARRIFWVGEALRAGLSVDEVHEVTAIDPWFLREIEEIVRTERDLVRLPADARAWKRAKGMGFSD